MSRAVFSGAGACEDLARFVNRALDDLAPGRIRYALRVDAAHRVSADLTVWRLGADRFELMSGRHMDIDEGLAACSLATEGVDLSADSAIFALQGPASLQALQGLTDLERLARLAYFAHGEFTLAGIPCRVGRLGYTGERGFELVTDRAGADALWECLAARATPAGFAAADRLRIEAGFILFANECRVAPSPTELALGRFYAHACPPPRMRLTGFTAGCDTTPTLWQPASHTLPPPGPGEITITSACPGPRASAAGLGFVPLDPPAQARDPAGRFENIRIRSLPMYDPDKARPRGPWTPRG